MHNKHIFLLGLIGVVTTLASARDSAAQCAGLPNCQLVWADEFDGTALDLTKWEYMLGNGSQFGIPGWGNNELQYYTSNNAVVAGGALTITAREEEVGNYDYTSSRLRTLGRGDWTYGRFEMRAKLPVTQGMWPAFWMLSSNPSVYGTWAASGEMDIMESIGSQPERILGSLHYGGAAPANQYTSAVTFLPPGTATDYHVYAMEWEAGEVRWYVDGQQYGSRTSWWSSGGPYPAPFDIDFHLLLNLAVGGNFPGNPNGSTVFPQEYVIDYVRVYQTPPQGTPGAAIVFDDMEHGNPFANGWFSFNSDIGGGGINPDSADLPPIDGGSFSLASGWGSGGTAGFLGGFGRTSPRDLAGLINFSFWINPDANQTYTLEVNLQEDDNNDGQINAGDDDEFQYNCVVSPSGPCAVSGGGWQKVTVPLSSFYDDNSFLNGGNGVLDATLAGNGQLISIVVTVISPAGNDVTFRTDQWTFNGPADADMDGVADAQDNCTEVANSDQRDTNGDNFGNACDADLSNDCIVNTTDLGLFRAVFFSADPDADFDGNGVVNTVDLGILKQRFFAPPGPSGTTGACAP